MWKSALADTARRYPGSCDAKRAVDFGFARVARAAMTEVREVARIELPTVSGEFDTRAFESASGHVYLAMVKGEIGDGHSVLTRVHSECLTGRCAGLAAL